MKKGFMLLKMYFFSAMVGGLVLATGCNGAAQNADSETTTESEVVKEDGMEYNAAYICPMHCPGSGSDTMGVCPTCGMDYVANENHPMHQKTDSSGGVSETN